MIGPQLIGMIERHEGYRQFPYMDCCGKPYRECQCAQKGKLTVGYGLNLDDDGIGEFEAEWLMERQLIRIAAGCDKELEWFSKLDPSRQAVVLDMVYQLGAKGFRSFKKMIAALEQSDYATAAAEMLNSTWATQVPARAHELADMMRKGWQA